jgi:sulfopyruvate decarboxylase subunit alpha
MSASSSPDAPWPPAWAFEICRGLVELGTRDVVYVPDNPLSHVLRWIAADTKIRTTIATREEEAFGIAAGLYLGGARPVAMLQSSGLGNSINALASLNVAFEIPVLMLITMRGGPGEWNPTQHPMGLAVRPILDALHIPHLTIEDAQDAARRVLRAGEAVRETSRPGAVLLARKLWSPGAASAPTPGSANA